MEKNIKNLKLIENNNKIFALVFYSNGVLVVIDFNGFIGSEHNYDFREDRMNGEILTFLLVVFVGFWMFCGSRVRVRWGNFR
jgi:uncharacterized membrane protein